MRILSQAARVPLYALVLVTLIEGIGINLSDSLVLALLLAFTIVAGPVLGSELVRMHRHLNERPTA